MADPTYAKAEIAKNPVWQLAFDLSEIHNDSAPIGWGSYIWVAECLMATYDMKRREDPKVCTACQGTGNFYYGTGHTGKPEPCPECKPGCGGQP